MNPNFVDMQGYQVSARKYRPPRFDELVGQEHITTTLLNAIAKNQLAQAYLFCGPRGVGKTSCARIFAKTINCSQRDTAGEACGACPSCLSFDQGGSLAIHELDAASNNSVDDIRSLVEQVRYPPQGSAFKVYIVDEVHMLSTAAFNALLKTLEEPPSYAKFILATTEKHKILPTILSRCQIFDFKRIRPQDIADRLATVCNAENFTFDHEALLTIAGRSDGALRDALTMLDQLAGYGGGHLGLDMVAEQLGVLNQQGFWEATNTLQQGDPGPILHHLGDLVGRGYDPIQWVLGMATHLRNLMMAKAPGTLDLVEASPEFKEKLLQQAKNSDVGFLLGGLHLLNQVELQYRQARQPRLLVETALFKIAYLALRSQSPAEPSKTNENVMPQGTAKPQRAAMPQEQASMQHPLEGISDKIPPSSGFKTPAKVRIQAPPTPSEAPARDFLNQIKKHLGNQAIKGNSSDDDAQQWNPPANHAKRGLNELWNLLLEQCRERSLGPLEGILARNIPQNTDLGPSESQKLDVILYSDTEKELFDREKSGILAFLRAYGPQETRLEWQIVQQNLGKQREKYLTEQERFNRLMDENDDFKDLKSQLSLFLM